MIKAGNKSNEVSPLRARHPKFVFMSPHTDFLPLSARGPEEMRHCMHGTSCLTVFLRKVVSHSKKFMEFMEELRETLKEGLSYSTEYYAHS